MSSTKKASHDYYMAKRTNARLRAMMRESGITAHTPGPWFAEKHGAVTAQIANTRRQVATTIGEVAMHDDRGLAVTEIQQANAALMAAAPDLLAACELALGNLPGRRESGGCTIRNAVEAHLRAAIAKARGGK